MTYRKEFAAYHLKGFDKKVRPYVFTVDEIEGLSDLIRERGITPDILHKAVFMCWVALKVKIVTIDEIFNDYGLLHEIAHIMCFGPSSSIDAASVDDVIKLAEKLEERLSKVSMGKISRAFASLRKLPLDENIPIYG